MNVAYNRDCMDVMKEYPDGYFDLAAVDPPYGDALHTDGGGNMGWFTKYREDSRDGSQTVHVERENAGQTDRPPAQLTTAGRTASDGTDSDSGSTATNTKRLRFHGGDRWDRYLRPEAGGVSRTGGTWASKYEKKIISWDAAPKQEYFEELFRVSRNQIIWGGQLFSSPPDKMFSDLA